MKRTKTMIGMTLTAMLIMDRVASFSTQSVIATKCGDIGRYSWRFDNRREVTRCGISHWMDGNGNDLNNKKGGKTGLKIWKRCGVLEFSSSDGVEEGGRRLESMLSKLTSLFPVFVLSSSILGALYPPCLAWVGGASSKSGSPLITLMLASVMIGMGMTLQKQDFSDVLVKRTSTVPLGVLCQFLIMPIVARSLGKTLLFPIDSGPALYLGLVLVGCVPGGTASNLVSLIAGADVALSVVLTSCSTLLAAFVTPLLVKFIIKSTVQISAWKLFEATAEVVFLPVIMGMLLNAKAPDFSRMVSIFTPFASVVLVSLICGGVVAQNAATLTSPASSSILLPMLLSVASLHTLGFTVGYLIPKFLFQSDEKSARTISIEVGMQNSALAVVLARSIGGDPLAALPGAISATMHSCLGSVLAAYWRFVDRVDKEKN